MSSQNPALHPLGVAVPSSPYRADHQRGYLDARYRVAILEDHDLTARMLASIVSRDEDYNVVGMAATVHDMIDVVRSTSPDVVLLDLILPDSTGMACAHALREEFPTLRVVFITGQATTDLVKSAMEEHPEGFLTKDASPDELLEAMRLVSMGSTFTSQRITEVMLGGRRAGQRDLRHIFGQLTDREIDIISRMIDGHSTTEIAAALNISEHTVATHRKNIYRKLGVRTLADLQRRVLRPNS